MGWTEFRDFPELSRAEIIRRELSQAPTADNPRAWGFEYITERGAVVYAIGWSDAPDRPRQYFGLVCLTSRHRSEYFGRAFSYKDMTEDMGPNYYDAPAKMLDMLDRLAPNPPGQYAANWRKACRDRIAAKRTRTEWKAGDRIEYGRAEYILQRPAGPRLGWHVVHAGSLKPYRIPARALAHARKLQPQEKPATFTKEVTPEQFFRDHVQFIHVGA